MSDTLQQLQQLCERRAAIDWFKGVFKLGHVELTDTGEQFTIAHHGSHVTVEKGLLGERPNFVVPLTTQNITNLTGLFADDVIDAHEQYRIVKFMLQPCLKAALAMPVLQNKAFRMIVDIDSHWQEALRDPNGQEDEKLTVIYVNDQWLIIPGYHGTPQRRLVMTPEQVLDYQRRVFEANEKNSLPGWLALGTWYRQWREQVSVPAA